MYARRISSLNLIGLLLLIVFFGFVALVGVGTRSWAAGILGVGITVFLLVQLFTCVRYGIRRPTSYEWFKMWMCVRPVLFGAIGAAVFWTLAVTLSTTSEGARFNPDAPALAVLIPLLILWLAALIYLIFRAPLRWESDAQYKRRIGYRG